MPRKLCAYCDGPPPFTREHIWPNGFLKRDSFDIKFSARANKTFKGDLVIADVCADCNNGPLSRLDDHACELYDRRFGKPVRVGEVVPFTYDYGLLMRWLLKLSYNSSRSTGQDAEVLSRFREVIRSENPCSPVWAVAKLATVGPSDMLNTETGARKRIYPKGVARCGPIMLPSLDVSNEAVLRCVMINSFHFSLVISKSPEVSGAVSTALERLPGQPLSYDGRMRLAPPSFPLHEAIKGIEDWPGL